MKMGSLEVRILFMFCARLTTTGDLFDEADFSVAESGNPDEIVLEQETHRRQQHPLPNNRNAQRWTAENMPRAPPPNFAAVTPSKPERSWTPAPGPRPAVHNGTNHIAQEQRRSYAPGPPGPQNYPSPTKVQLPQSRSSQDANTQAADGQFNVNAGGKPQGMGPPNSSPSVDGQRRSEPSSTAFFSARAADKIGRAHV